MATKAELHALIDGLPADEGGLAMVARLLADDTVQMLFCTPDGEPPLSWREFTSLLAAYADDAADEHFEHVGDAIEWLKTGHRPTRIER